MNPQQLALIVQRGHQEAYDTLLQEFAPKGFCVFWDRRVAERRRCNIPVAVERRGNHRRQETDAWNVQHFRVVLLTAPQRGA